MSALTFRLALRCSLALALVGGFTLAWVCMDLRTMVDHVDVVRGVEERGRPLPIVTEAKDFADRAAEIIGSGTWSSELTDHVVAAHYCGYAFAEHGYVSPDHAETADFLVSAEPAGRAVVWQHGPYYLLRKGAP